MSKTKTGAGYWVLHHKCILFMVFFVTEIVFLDRDSLITRYKIHKEKAELKADLQKYQQIYSRDSRQLRSLEKDPNTIEKIARERYFMKSADEDVYVVKYADDANNLKDNNGKIE